MEMTKWILIVSALVLGCWVTIDDRQQSAYPRQAALKEKEILTKRLCLAPKHDRWSLCQSSDFYVGNIKVGCRAPRKEAPDDWVVYINWDQTVEGSAQDFSLSCN